MYKNNSRDSGILKGCSPLQLSCNLTGKYYAVGYYSYTHVTVYLKNAPYERLYSFKKTTQ